MAVCRTARDVIANMWLWIGLGALAFILGFMLSWLQMRRHLQKRVNRVVVNEVARSIEGRVLDELRGRRPRLDKGAAENNQGGDQHNA